MKTISDVRQAKPSHGGAVSSTTKSFGQVVLLLGELIHSLVSQVPLMTAIQDVISGIVGIVSDLGNAIARVLSNILPQPRRNRFG